MYGMAAVWFYPQIGLWTSVSFLVFVFVARLDVVFAPTSSGMMGNYGAPPQLGETPCGAHKRLGGACMSSTSLWVAMCHYAPPSWSITGNISIILITGITIITSRTIIN